MYNILVKHWQITVQSFLGDCYAGHQIPEVGGSHAPNFRDHHSSPSNSPNSPNSPNGNGTGQVADRIGICEKPGLRLRRTAGTARHRPTENRGALGAGPFVKRLQLGVQRFILLLLIPLPMNSQEILPSLYVHGGMTMTRQSPDMLDLSVMQRAKYFA